MKRTVKSSMAIAPLAAVLCSLTLGSAAMAASPATTPSATPSTSANPSTSSKPAGSPSATARHGLTQAQKDALAAALTTYKAAIQSALDGAHKAIADAQSIRDQAFAAAPKDKNVRNLANQDFKNSSTQIWNAFKSSTAAAKATYDSTISTIKASH
jgi:hypothetical protein